MKNQLTALRDDYEVYCVSIPWKAIFAGNLSKYIYAQLGKLHRCFCEDFAFDYKCWPGLKGINTKIVVIEKSILAAYFRTSKKKELVIEGKKQNHFFRKKITVKKWVFMAVVFLLIIAAAKNWITGALVKKNKDSENYFVMEERKVPVELSEKGDGLELVVKEIAGKNGQVLWLNWKLDGFRENFRLKVKGVFPEEINCSGMELENTVVIYENKIPEFELSGWKKLFSETEDKNEISEIGKNEDELLEKKARGSLRNLILSNGGNISSENYYPVKFSISCEKEKFGNLMKEFEKFQLEEKTYTLVSMEVFREKEEFRINVAFEKNVIFGGEKIFKVLGENEKLFDRQENQKDMQEKNDALLNQQIEKIDLSKAVEKKSEAAGIKLVEIGKVKHGDGTLCFFYKTPEGKIITREENEK